MTRDQFKKIESVVFKEMENAKAPHDLNHVKRVRKNALHITRILNLEDKLDINILEAATLLHDLTYSEKRTNLYTYIFEKWLAGKKPIRILKIIGIDPFEQKILINAITKHPYSIPYQKLNKNEDLYTKILQDADTLDYFHKQRIDTFKQKFQKSVFLGLLLSLSLVIIKILNNKIKIFLNFPEISDNFYE